MWAAQAHSGAHLVQTQAGQNTARADQSGAFQALRNRAVAAGRVSLDVSMVLPAGVEQDNTAAQMAARQASIVAEVAAFQARYGANVVGSIEHGILTPMLSAQFTAAGLDQLLVDTKVGEFSAEGRYQGQLNAIYNSVGVAALPLPSGPMAGPAVAIIDTGVQIPANGTPGPAAGNEFHNRIVRAACFSKPFAEAGTFNKIRLCQQVQTGFPPAQVGSACTRNGQLIGNEFLNLALANCGHGTHVAGIASGNRNNILSDSGVAPFAPVIAIHSKSLGRDRFNRLIADHAAVDVIKSLDQIRIWHISGTPVAAVNMSFGSVGGDAIDPWTAGSCVDYGGTEQRNYASGQSVGSLNAAIEGVVQAGIAVVAAAGNRLPKTVGTTVIFEGSYGMAHPACLPNVIAVGATGKSNQSGVAYSVYGFNKGKKANILAPGGDGDTPSDPALNLPAARCINGGGSGGVCSASKDPAAFSNDRESRSGTSMSAPVITGLIQRLTTRFPNATGVQAGETLINSGTPTTVNANFGTTQFPNSTTLTIPRVNVAAAVQRAGLIRNLSTSSQGCANSAVSAQLPELMLPAGYRYRIASTVAGLTGAGIAVSPIVSNGSLSFALNNPGSGFVQMQAFDAVGNGAWTDPAALNSTNCAPAAMPNLVADRIGTGSGQFCWGSIANATSYEMEDRPLGSAFTGQATVNSISDLNHPGSLDPFSFPEVRAKLRACNVNGCGGWSPEAQLMDRDVMSLPPPDYISPCSSL